GLGLALVKHVLNRHGGRLTIESVLGQGATFTTHVPLADPLAGENPQISTGSQAVIQLSSNDHRARGQPTMLPARCRSVADAALPAAAAAFAARSPAARAL